MTVCSPALKLSLVWIFLFFTIVGPNHSKINLEPILKDGLDQKAFLAVVLKVPQEQWPIGDWKRGSGLTEGKPAFL